MNRLRLPQLLHHHRPQPQPRGDLLHHGITLTRRRHTHPHHSPHRIDVGSTLPPNVEGGTEVDHWFRRVPELPPQIA